MGTLVDIINVVSVTNQAIVNHWLEENDSDVQENLYWRQAFDVRTLELSVWLKLFPKLAFRHPLTGVFFFSVTHADLHV
jgi:hypothetical protein